MTDELKDVKEATPVARHPWRVSILFLVALVVLLSLAFSRRGAEPDGPAAGVAPDAYRAITLGIDEEALTERLRPARPLEQPGGQATVPAPTADTCLYYEARGEPAGDRYRFCFADDRLVDKDLVAAETSG